MSAASPVGGCCGWTSAPVDVLTVEPAFIGCLQVQPAETVDALVNMQPWVARLASSARLVIAPAMTARQYPATDQNRLTRLKFEACTHENLGHECSAGAAEAVASPHL